MTINVTERSKDILVEYESDSGETASVVVVGDENLESVRSRADQIVASYELKEKADS